MTVEQLQAILDIPPHTSAELNTAIRKIGLHLDHFHHEGIDYVLFRDATGTIVPIPAGIYGEVLGKIGGFAIASDKLSPKVFAEVHQTHVNSIMEGHNSNAELPAFTPELVKAVLFSLRLFILQDELGISDDYFHILQQGLARFGLSLSIEITKHGYIHILFTDKSGAYTPVPEGTWKNWIGFLVPIGFNLPPKYQRTKRMETVATKSRNLTKEFQRITLDKQVSLPVLDPHHLSLFLLETRNELTTHQQIPANETLHSEERNELQSNVIEYLQQFLNPQGLDVVIAKKTMHQSAADQSVEQTLRTRTPFPLVDLLIVKKDQPDINLDYIQMYGWGKTKDYDDSDGLPVVLTVYGNVCGIVLIDESMNISERKQLVRTASAQLRRYYPTAEPKPTILTVDRSLLNEWQRHGTPLPPPEEVDATLERVEPKKLVDYGIYPSRFNINKAPPPRVELHIYEPNHSHIGGTQLTLVVIRDDQVSSATIFDRGYIFGLRKSWNSLGKGPTYSELLPSYLKSGMFDMTRRLYGTSFLTQALFQLNFDIVISHTFSPQSKNAFNSVEEFICLEIFHRFGADGFEQQVLQHNRKKLQELKQNHQWNRLIKHLRTRHALVYKQKTIFDLAFLSHSHFDHNLGFALIRDDVVRGFSSTTRALALADHRLSSNILAQGVAARKMRELPKIGNTYPVIEFPYFPFEDGTEIEISPGVFIKGHEVKHSIYGTMGASARVEHHGKTIAKVAYGADYKDGEFFRKIGEEGGTDLLLVEGTNPPSASGTKDSMNQTEDTVMNNFNEALITANNEDHLMIVDLVKNAFERLENLIAVARARQRSIILSPKILRRIQLVHLITQGRQRLPNIHPSDPNIFVWKPLKARYSTEEQDLYEMYRQIGPNQLNSNEYRYRDFMLIREGEAPEKLEDLGPEVTWIYSGYGAYTEAAENERDDRQDFADKKGWKYFSKGFHASGHAVLLKRDHPRSEEGVLAQLHRANAKRILPLHTEHRGEVAKVIKEYVPGTKVIDRLSHPRAKIVLA